MANIKHDHPHEHPHEHPVSEEVTALVKALVKVELDAYEQRIRAAMRDEWKKLNEPGAESFEEREVLAAEGASGAKGVQVRGGVQIVTRSY